MRHGATFKTCSHEGCTKYVISAGVCRTHGAKFKLCRYEGCTNQVIKGGVCARHGAKRKSRGMYQPNQGRRAMCQTWCEEEKGLLQP